MSGSLAESHQAFVGSHSQASGAVSVSVVLREKRINSRSVFTHVDAVALDVEVQTCSTKVEGWAAGGYSQATGRSLTDPGGVLKPEKILAPQSFCTEVSSSDTCMR